MKLKKIIIMALCLSLVMTCGVFLAACNKGGGEGGGKGGGDTYVPRNSNQWFTEAELAKKGLSALPAPTGLSGDMSSDLNWFNDGYSFHQACPDEDTFTQNAVAYLSYFKSKYNERFGVAKPFMYGEDETFYKITQKTDLADYFSDNPSSLYKFYYVTDKTLEEGYFKADAVWTFEIRYEFNTTKNTYLFKIFIENARKQRNSDLTYYYKMA